MEIINVNIKNTNDFFEIYNDKIISQQLLKYLIESAKSIGNKKFKIVITSKLDINFNDLLINNFKRELENSYIEKKRTNLAQLCLIVLGIFFISLSVLFKKYLVSHEILLIIGWVPIWEAIDIELFRDSKARKRRYLLNKLLNSKIEIVK